MPKRDAIGLDNNDWALAAPGDADSGGLNHDELSKILNAVSALMTASGQRQSTAMHDMRQRISELSDEAQDVSRSVPAGQRGSFQRIADAMSELADRVAEEHERPHSVPQAVVSDGAGGATFVGGQSDGFQPSSAAVERPGASAGSGADQRLSAARRETTTEYMVDLENPWDESSAEQLTRLYEDAAFNTEYPVAPEVSVPEPVVTASAPPAPVVKSASEATQSSEPAGITPQDRNWLSKQFAEIATNIELSSATSDRYDTAISSIEERLDALEGLVRTAVQDGATRSDVASLADIETVIFEFAAQFEKTQAELVRIERLEEEITTLASRLSEERVEAMASVTAQSTEPLDAEGIAEFVAGRVAEQSAKALAAMLPDNSGHMISEFNDLKDLLHSLIAERQNEGRETGDRLQSIETSVKELLERASAAASVSRQEPLLPERLAEHADGQAGWGQSAQAGSGRPHPTAAQPAHLDQSLADPIPSALSGDIPARAVDSPDPASYPMDGAEEYEPADHIDEPLPEYAGDLTVGREGDLGAATASKSQAPSREDFMAQARRAAAKANERAEMQGVEAAGPQKRRAGGAATGEDAKPRSSRIRVALAVLAVVVLVSGGASLIVGWTGQSIGSLIGLSYKVWFEAPAKVAVPPKPEPANRQSRIPTIILPDAQGDLRSKQTLPARPSKPTVPASLNPSLPPSEPEQTGAALDNPTAARRLPPALIGPLSLRLAAANGNPSAAFEVGARFAEGKGVKQDFGAAAKWYTRSAAAGFALSQYRLATLYERGLGVEKDAARAKIWYERAAKLGNTKAMHNLAVLSAGGSSSKADYGEAARWFAAAAERGLSDSQFNLAILYQNGLGVTKDLKLAFQWFAIAARFGDSDANKRRESLLADVTPSDVERMSAIVASWSPKSTSRIANDAGYAGAQWRSQSNAGSINE